MRVAFYCPLKPPDHPTPSGDRRMARELMAALTEEGAEVVLASRLRSRLAAPDDAAFASLAKAGQAEAARLIAAWQENPAERPDLWLTYHCYHKAPDLIGPKVAWALSIPYVLVEASVAGKRAQGPWAWGYQAALDAVQLADCIVCPNPGDAEGLAPHVRGGHVLVDLPPFLDGAPYRRAREKHSEARVEWAARLGLPAQDTSIWCLAVGMMRADAKRESYRLLAEAMRQVPPGPWRIILAGDGPARAEVEAAFHTLPVHFSGEVGAEELAALYGASDLFLWPAIQEAYGYALLEAQAAGLPAVVGRSPGTANIVRAGETGLLTPLGDAACFADAAAILIADKARREGMGRTALTNAATRHDRKAAGETLMRRLRALIAGARP